ncbi:MAG TPA: glycosyltransferase, partial [Ktedonobacteraceae bacterium]
TRPYRPGIPADILALSQERDLLRRRGHYDRADQLKQRIEQAGYLVKDNPHGAHLVILPSIEVDHKIYRTVRDLPSLLDEPDTCTFSVNLLARNNQDELRRCIESILRFAGSHTLEIVVVDNASRDDANLWIEALKQQDARIRVLRATRMMGIAEARNLGLQQSQGRYILLLDSNVELNGDIFTPLSKALASDNVGLAGPCGLLTDDLRHFEESERSEVEAIAGFCLACKRSLLSEAGLFDERFRYAHFMDIDFNFALRELGVQARRTPDLPLISHPSSAEADLSDAERARQHKRNFYRFLEKWGDRDDLLLEE